MSEWQKVRIQFTDADGNEVSAVMWKDSPDAQFASVKPEDGNCWIGWNLAHDVKFTPIRGLPTGVGAVIRIKDVGIFVRNLAGIWCAEEASEDRDIHTIAGLEYEVLSEGIKL